MSPSPFPIRRRALLGAAVGATGAALLPAGSARAQAGAPPTVAAAADLKFALEEIAAAHQRAGGAPVRLVFGSSGQFLTQLLQGAPFQLFLSADEQLVFKLAEAGRTRDRGALYARGRLALFTPQGSPLRPDLDDLAAGLRDGRVRKLAIANPEHAPYGARAREALQSLGLWEAALPRLVFGENVAQAAQFASSGATQGGLIALSLARAPSVAALGASVEVPERLHQPLRQRMVLMKGAPPAAVAFHDLLLGAPAQAVLARHGFAPPAA